MKYQTIDDVYAAGAAAHADFKSVVAKISGDDEMRRDDAARWSIAQTVEHVALVEEMIAGLVGKMLNKAAQAGVPAASHLPLRPEFFAQAKEAAATKFQAPESARPTGSTSAAEAMARLDAAEVALEALKPLFEKYDCAQYTMPHPYFGELNAAEWLAVAVGHKVRHLAQINSILELSSHNHNAAPNV